MKSSTNLKKVDTILIILMILFTLISYLPIEYHMAVYTPSILGYFWLLSVPIILLLMIITCIIDYRKKNAFPSKRILVFVTFIILSVLIWYTRAYLKSN